MAGLYPRVVGFLKRKEQVFTACWFVSLFCSTAIAQSPKVQLELKGEAVRIKVGEREVGLYEFGNQEILRPFFSNLKTPNGMQVTRSHPPGAGDSDDHATMHPGVWIAFGDISGDDFWRNKASVRHQGLTIKDPLASGAAGFVQQKDYVSKSGAVLCSEIFDCSILTAGNDLQLVFDISFGSKVGCYFGDQEEMGLGVRVATQITEKAGGILRDSEGRTGAKQIWSRAAAWCDYAGEVEGQPVGVTLFCHPENFRSSWFHARNYGLMVANPFGRKAMKKGARSKVRIDSGETLRLRYAVWLHGKATAAEIDAAFERYLTAAQ